MSKDTGDEMDLIIHTVIIADLGSFGMLCFLSAVCGYIGNCIGRGLALFWADVHIQPDHRRRYPRLSTLMGWLGFFIPPTLVLVSYLMGGK